MRRGRSTRECRVVAQLLGSLSLSLSLSLFHPTSPSFTRRVREYFPTFELFDGMLD